MLCNLGYSKGQIAILVTGCDGVLRVAGRTHMWLLRWSYSGILCQRVLAVLVATKGMEAGGRKLGAWCPACFTA